ncbi:MAG: hypothetical protein HQ494_09865 [Rhodospirillales bacterium]|nr:hypothetical protein [Rhodospirillales bacterium]
MNILKAFFDSFQPSNIRGPIAIVLGFHMIFHGIVGQAIPEREFGESLALSRSRTGLKNCENCAEGENNEELVFDFIHNVSVKMPQKETV